MVTCFTCALNGRLMSRHSACQSVQFLSSPSTCTRLVCLRRSRGAATRTVPSPMDLISRSGSSASFPLTARSPSAWPAMRYSGRETGTSP